MAFHSCETQFCLSPAMFCCNNSENELQHCVFLPVSEQAVKLRNVNYQQTLAIFLCLHNLHGLTLQSTFTLFEDMAGSCFRSSNCRFFKSGETYLEMFLAGWCLCLKAG